MTDYEAVSAFLAGVSAVAAVGGFWGLNKQLTHAELTAKRERERVRRQATLELVIDKFFEVRELRESLRTLLQSDATPAEVLKRISVADEALSESHGRVVEGSEHDLGGRVRRYLTYLEFLAIGVEQDILDRNVVAEMSGKHFLRVYKNLSAYIESIKGSRNDRAYSNFVSLVEQLYPVETARLAAERKQSSTKTLTDAQ